MDVIAIARAIKQNLQNRKVVSGASTITMQLMRMSRKGQSRNLYQKMVESVWALRAELRYSKDEIIRLYSSHAPFGGNVIGLEAASWRYFGRSPWQLSWAECATLAVLPNQPSLIHPGRNRNLLRAKRDALLLDLQIQGLISEMDYEAALLEEVPQQPQALPRHAPHLLHHLSTTKRLGRMQTSIDYAVQERAQRIVHRHHKQYRENDIHNAAVLIIDNKSNEVISYIANTATRTHEGDIDMIQSERSSGSILKPLLYASMIDDRRLTPHMLVPDIPSYIDGYKPENYHKKFSGAVPAAEALSKSLNVPATLMLQEYGVDRFRDRLKHYGISTLHYSADHYGLPLILGGAEVTLWDVTNIYAAMARTLERHYTDDGRYTVRDWDQASLTLPTDRSIGTFIFSPTHISAAAIWSTFEALQRLSRPDEEGHWENFSSSRRLAWKSGTSYGHRDAWTIGCTHRYTIGVWVGNADGEGRPGIVGAQAAGSLMFDILNILPQDERWYYEPMDEMYLAPICNVSGHIASQHCTEVDSTYIPRVSMSSGVCRYHVPLFLDPSLQYQVNSSCDSSQKMVKSSWFVLPPQMAAYYKLSHADYKETPPLDQSCTMATLQQPVDLIYPYSGASIYLPVDLDGEQQQTVASASHSHESSTLYWHLDGKYLGSTRTFHTMAIDTDMGDHQLIVVDNDGHSASTHFEVLKRAE